MWECPLPLNETECAMYASYFQETLNYANMTAASGCLYDQEQGTFHWNMQSTMTLCKPYKCICKRHRLVDTKYTYGKRKQLPFKNRSGHIRKEVVVKDTLITEKEISLNTTLYTINFNEPATSTRDVFFRKENPEITTSYEFTYTRKLANGNELRPIDQTLYRNLEEAKRACSLDAANCRGVNEKVVFGTIFYTRHKIGQPSDIHSGVFGEESSFLRHRKLVQDSSYKIMYERSVDEAKQKCDELSTCFSHGQENAINNAFITTTFVYGIEQCDSINSCEASCAADESCEGYSSLIYTDATVEWATTDVYSYSGYSCDDDLDCRVKCAMDITCEGYTQRWRARAYDSYSSQENMHRMSGTECGLLGQNDFLWVDGHPKHTAAINDGNLEWYEKDRPMCSSWYEPDRFGYRHNSGGCRLAEYQSYYPGRIDLGMEGCRIVGQIGNRQCMPEVERNKVLWTLHYDSPRSAWTGNNNIEGYGYGQSWTCTNLDMVATSWNPNFYDHTNLNPDECYCAPDNSVNTVNGEISLNYRFEETVYKQIYYTYGVRSEGQPAGVTASYPKTQNGRHFMFGVRQDGILVNDLLEATKPVYVPQKSIFYEAPQTVLNSVYIQRNAGIELTPFISLFFKTFPDPRKALFEGSLTTNSNTAFEDCSNNPSCDGINVLEIMQPNRAVFLPEGVLNIEMEFSNQDTDFKVASLIDYYGQMAATYVFNTTDPQTWIMTPTYTEVHFFNEIVNKISTTCDDFCAGYMFQHESDNLCFCKNTLLPVGQSVFTTGDCLDGFERAPNGTCIKCFTNEYSLQDGCHACPAGYKGVGAPGLESCLICPAGRYLNVVTEGNTCEACSIGRYAPSEGSTSPSDCIECELGKYTDQIATTACTDCALGNKYSTTECDECPIGTYNNAHDYECDICDMGTYNDETGQASCKECTLGHRYVQFTICEDCPAGKYNDVLDDECNLCNNTHYQDEVGQTTCKLCPDGKRVKINHWYYAHKGGAPYNHGIWPMWSAPQCPGECMPPKDEWMQPLYHEGHRYGNHFLLKNKVPPSYEGASDVSECRMIPCPAGTEMVYEGHHDLYTNTFPADTYFYYCGENCLRLTIPEEWVTPAPTCTPCPAGRYGTDTELHFNNESCTDCLLPLYQDETAQLSCKRCEEGFFLTIATPNTCTQCKEGFYNDEKDQYDCKQCEGGYVDSHTSTSCEACTPGRYTPVPSETCKSCHTGVDEQQLHEVLLSKQNLVFNGATCSSMTTCLDICREDNNCMGFSAWTTGISSSMLYTYGPRVHAALFTLTDSQNVERSLFSSYYLPTKKLFEDVNMTRNMTVQTFFSGGVNCTNCPPGESARESAITIEQPEILYGFCKGCNFTLEYYESLTELCTECDPGKVTSVHDGLLSAINSPTPAYLQQLNAEACIDCPLGTIGINPLDYCSGCFGTEGKYMDETAQTECKTCVLGSVLDVVASNVTAKSCTPCLRGYQNELMQDSCKLCPIGRINTQIEGAKTLDEGCSLCVAGRYNDETDKNTCKLCPSGRYLPTEGETSLSNCILCNAGYYHTLEGQVSINACTECEPGKYEDEQGSSGCNDCAKGKYSDGTTAATSETVCVSCEAGFYNDLEGQVYVAACKLCDAGQFSNEAATFACKNCLVGRFKPSDSQTDCNDCPIDTYQNLEGQGECKRCPNGRYNDLTLQTECKVCDAGQHNDMSDTSTSPNLCEMCPYAKYAPKANAVNPDDAGYGSEDACIFCPAGQYGEELGIESCKQCEAGKEGAVDFYVSYSGRNDWSVNAALCERYAASRSDLTWGGSVYQGGNSQHLSPWGCYWRSYEGILYYNTHSGWGAASCVYYNSWQYACVRKSMPSTTVPQTEDVACTECRAGYYSTEAGTGTCTACEAGRFQTSTFSTDCTVCALGKYEPSTAQTVCDDLCSPGKYGISRSIFNDFSVVETSYEDSGLNTVLLTEAECEAFVSSLNGGGSTGLGPGLGGVVSATYAGVLNEVGNPQGCFRQGNTYYFNENTDSTAPCGAYGVSICVLKIELNPISENTACANCPIGTENLVEGITDISSCQNCAKGKYNDVPGDECKLCASGKFKNGVGAYECDLCAPGYYSGDGAVTCTACPTGRFVGSYGSDSLSDCTPCGKGKFADVSGLSSCKLCPQGQYQNELDKVSCKDCGWGTHQDQTGQQGCKNCPTGRYSNENKLVYCHLCAAGKVQASTGQTSCNNCGTGQSTNGNTGWTSCQNCANGKYQDQEGGASCKTCPGCTTSTHTSGSTSCKRGDTRYKFASSTYAGGDGYSDYMGNEGGWRGYYDYCDNHYSTSHTDRCVKWCANQCLNYQFTITAKRTVTAKVGGFMITSGPGRYCMCQAYGGFYAEPSWSYSYYEPSDDIMNFGYVECKYVDANIPGLAGPPTSTGDPQWRYRTRQVGSNVNNHHLTAWDSSIGYGWTTSSQSNTLSLD